MNGEHWECSADLEGSPVIPDNPGSPLFFQFSMVGQSQASWVGIVNQVSDPSSSDEAAVLLPTSGSLGNLMVKTTGLGQLNPGPGESYTVTLFVNGQSTLLSCSIIDTEESCSDTTNNVSVNEGDTIVLRVEASGGAPFVTIKPSLFLS